MSKTIRPVAFATRILAFAALALVLGGLPATASEGWAYDMADELMSPFCPGRTLAECPSQQAETLRMWLIVQETSGRTRADVEAELLERYGDVILAAPRAEGIGITAYALPALAFVAGGVLVFAFLRRQTRASARERAERPASQPLDPELERVVDEELSR